MRFLPGALIIAVMTAMGALMGLVVGGVSEWAAFTGMFGAFLGVWLSMKLFPH